MNSSAVECMEINSSPVISEPPTPKGRRSLRSEAMEENSLNYSLNNRYQSSEKKTSRQQNTSNLSENKELSKDQSTSYETQMTQSSNEEDEEAQSLYQNRSKTISPKRDVCLKPETHINSVKNTSSYSYYFILIIVVVIGFLSFSNENKVQTQSISNALLLSESIKNIKVTFHNQESNIWNDISSAINEVISRTPKIPSIILLFGKETTTMNCLATKLALMSSTILHADSYLVFRPEDFGNDAGEIITILNEHPLEKKKVVIIHDILSIDAEAIKALHNLCDRVNPLVAEAIYILTMQTNSYESQQKKLNFVENQIYNKLSKSIDLDVLMALVTRITDGAIISVQPEPQLRYC